MRLTFEDGAKKATKNPGKFGIEQTRQGMVDAESMGWDMMASYFKGILSVIEA